MKTCTSCSESKPLAEYGRLKSGKDGLRPTCRACRSLEGAAYYARNKGRHLEVGNAWRAANRQRVNERSRARGRQARLDAIDVHGGVCVECGTTENLILDHINGGGAAHRRHEGNYAYYRRIARTRVPDSRLQALCEDCHAPKTSREIAADNRRHIRTPRVAT